MALGIVVRYWQSCVGRDGVALVPFASITRHQKFFLISTRPSVAQLRPGLHYFEFVGVPERAAELKTHRNEVLRSFTSHLALLDGFIL